MPYGMNLHKETSSMYLIEKIYRNYITESSI